MLQHLFRIFFLFQFFQSDNGSGDGGSGDGTGDGKGSSDSGDSGNQGQHGPTQADLDKLDGALKAERGLNADIKRAAAEKGVSVADFLKGVAGGSGNADQTELNTLKQQIADLTKNIETERTNVRTARIEAALTSAANTANARSSAAVVALLRDSIELDDAGKPTGVKEAIAALQKDDPGLFKHADGRGDGGRPARDQKDIQPGYDRLSEAYATDSTTANTR